MFCWLYFIPAFIVKKLKQEVLLDQCCLHLVKWSIFVYVKLLYMLAQIKGKISLQSFSNLSLQVFVKVIH